MATRVKVTQIQVSIKLKYCSTKKSMQNLHSKKTDTSVTRHNLHLSSVKYSTMHILNWSLIFKQLSTFFPPVLSSITTSDYWMLVIFSSQGLYLCPFFLMKNRCLNTRPACVLSFQSYQAHTVNLKQDVSFNFHYTWLLHNEQSVWKSPYWKF